MIGLALLLGLGSSAATASGSVELGDLYREFNAVCAIIGKGDIGTAALAAGWSPTTRAQSPELSNEVVIYDHEMYAFWHLEHNLYSKNISGNNYYIHERVGHPDAQDIRSCSLYSVRHPIKPTQAEVTQAVGKKPNYVSSDFGGVTYDFYTDPVPNVASFDITWLTHKLNPIFRKGELDRKAFDATLGPERPPTLVFELSITIKEPDEHSR